MNINPTPLRIAMIGLDTSHVEAFLKLLNNPSDPYYLGGATIVAAHPGDPSDFHMSRDRVQKYTQLVNKVCGDIIRPEIEDTLEGVDAVFLLSVDGRSHAKTFARIAPASIPVFIDKPFTTSSVDANRIVDLSNKYDSPIMSCSSLRFADDFVGALANCPDLFGADIYGPMPVEPSQGGLFWYGIHHIEMLIATLGVSFKEVLLTANREQEAILIRFGDNRIGSVRGNRLGNSIFGGTLHGFNNSQDFQINIHHKPLYFPMLEAILGFFRTGKSPIPLQETLAVIRLIETINAKRNQ